MKRDDDDLFLDTLEQDEHLAWTLVEGAARPAPSALRERILARHRRRGIFGLSAPRPAALAFALIATVVLPLSLALVQTRTELEREGALRDEYARVLAVVPHGMVVRMNAVAGRPERGALVIGTAGDVYMILDLPEPPAGKAYEAWLIRDGVPLRAGMAPVRSGVVTIPLDHRARSHDLFAVTLEVAAGVDKPTSAPVLDAGSPF